MRDRSHRLSRRKFLASAAGLTLAGGLAGSGNAQEPASGSASFRSRPGKPSREGRKPLAVVTTVYRPLSHAYHIAGRFLHGYPREGKFHLPQHYVASMYVDQRPDNDVSRGLAGEFDIRVGRTIEDALTAGTNKLAVDAVLLIGEHGNYPPNDKDQILYPRHKFMKEVVDVFRKTGQTVPVFNDKHLSYSWSQGQEMVGWARELKFPFMAGSSLPVTWRRPELELPLGSPIEDALVAAYGPVEVYGFHALETLQCMVERRFKPDAQARDGANQGVKAVTCLTGKDVWKAGDDGLWSWSLLEAALGRSETLCPGDVRQNTGSMPVGGTPATPATAFIVEYRDGLRATALLLNGHVADFTFAAKVKGEDKPPSCLFALPPAPGAKFFDCLVANIEKMLESGKPPYPVERTLLTGGVLDFAMDSRHKRGLRVETPDLDVKYHAPADSGFCRGSPAAPI